jgi:hypothetical protein
MTASTKIISIHSTTRCYGLHIGSIVNLYIYIYYQLQSGLCPVAVLHKQSTMRKQ